MPGQSISIALERFTNFGDLLRFLRRRTGLTQRELSIAVGYSHAQISRLELNQRLPDMATISARFIPVLDLEEEPQVAARLMELAAELTIQETPSPGNAPFKGLNYFDEPDAALFFGREELTALLVERLRAISGDASRTRFLAVVGASGSGKSSLVRAGLIPALRRVPFFTRRRILTFTPTAHPLQALAEAIRPATGSFSDVAALIDDFHRNPHSLHLAAGHAAGEPPPPSIRTRQAGVLLVVDQFEELFTLCEDETERRAFVENLLIAAAEPHGPVSVVISLRSDFYSSCDPYPLLRAALAGAQEFIGPMNLAELRRAIQEPARTNHWELEPGLVELLLKDLGGEGGRDPEPGSLPLLSHALLETWQRRAGRTLTVSGYLAAGGVRAAIAETADRIYADELEPDQQPIARRILLRLVQVNENEPSAETRRRSTIGELVGRPEDARAVREVLNLLADSRLVTTHDDQVELAHEALIREWPTLRAWLDQDRESLLIDRHLTLSAQAWSRLDRDPGELYRGARFSQAQEWARTHPDHLNPLQWEFLVASQAQFELDETRHERELQAARELAETRLHSSQQLRRRAVFLLAAFFLAVVLAGVALYQAELVRRSAITAQRNERISFSRELSAAALSSLDLDPERSILLGLQAAQVTLGLDRTVLPETEEALHRALVTSRVRLTLSDLGEMALSTAYSPDGRHVAGIGADGKVIVWDVQTGKPVFQVDGVTQVKDAKGVQRIAYSPNGARLAAGDAQFVKIYDPASGSLIQTLSGHTDDVWAVAYSPDGRVLASGGMDATLRLWDAETGALLHVLTGFQDVVETLAFSPDSREVAATSDDLSLKIWDAQTGQLLADRTDFSDVPSVTFSPDGEWIAAGSSAGVTVLSAADPLGPPHIFIPGAANVVRFSPDNARVAANSGSVVRVWDAETGRDLFTLSGHSGWTMDIAFSPDGNYLASASMDGTIKVWSMQPGQEIAAMAGSGIRVAYSPDGAWLAQEAAGGAVQLWNPQTGDKGTLLGATGAAILGFAFSPDGTRLAAGGVDKLVHVWDTTTGKNLLTLTGHSIGVRDVAYSPDGTRIASASFDSTARVWDASTGQELLKLEEPAGLMIGVAFSPDSSLLATSSNNGTAKVWDSRTGKLLFTLLGHTAGIPDIAFSPDGKLIATGSQDRTVRLWDSATGTLIRVMEGHSSEIQSLAFSPDGSLLASGSGDNTAILWEVSTGAALRTFFGSAGGVMGVAFNPDASRLAVSSADGIIRVYTLKVGELLALARSRVTRALAPAECRKYLHAAACPASP